jgi:uncharacterized DUF497 family protein
MELIFEWDASKAKHNLKKHRISFVEAKTIFNDPLLITFPDEHHSADEERYISIGASANNRILLVVHTECEEAADSVVIRIISCRKATVSERSTYEEGED